MLYLLLEKTALLSLDLERLGYKVPRKESLRLPITLFTSDLLEGKHSGIKIGHEQQKFRNKKLVIKRPV